MKNENWKKEKKMVPKWVFCLLVACCWHLVLMQSKRGEFVLMAIGCGGRHWNPMTSHGAKCFYCTECGARTAITFFFFFLFFFCKLEMVAIGWFVFCIILPCSYFHYQESRNMKAIQSYLYISRKRVATEVAGTIYTFAKSGWTEKEEKKKWGRKIEWWWEMYWIAICLKSTVVFPLDYS